MTDYSNFVPKVEYVNVSSAELQNSYKIIDGLLRGDKLVMVDGKQDLRDYFFRGNYLMEVLKVLGLDDMGKHGIGWNYIIDFLWKLSTLKHDYKVKDVFEYLLDGVKNFGTSMISSLPEAQQELGLLKVIEGEGIYKRIYPQQLLVMRALMMHVMGVYWPHFSVPEKIDQASLVGIYGTARYVLDIMDPSFNEKGLSIIEICSEYFDAEYTLFSLSLSESSKDQIVKLFEMSGKRVLSLNEVFEVMHDYIMRGYFDLPKEQRPPLTNNALAGQYGLGEDYTRQDILYIIEHGKAPQGFVELNLSSANWVIGAIDCSNSNTLLSGSPRKNHFDLGLWFSYGFKGDRVCYNASEILDSYDIEKRVFKVPDHIKITSSSMMDPPGVIGTLGAVFTYDQIKPLSDVIKQNINTIDKFYIGTAINLMGVIDKLHERFRNMDEMMISYNKLSYSDKDMLKRWLRLIIDTYKIIDINDKENTLKYYENINNATGQFSADLVYFTDKLSLINDRSEFALRCPQGGLGSVVNSGMNNQICNHTVFMLASKTASNILEAIK